MPILRSFTLKNLKKTLIFWVFRLFQFYHALDPESPSQELGIFGAPKGGRDSADKIFPLRENEEMGKAMFPKKERKHASKVYFHLNLQTIGLGASCQTNPPTQVAAPLPCRGGEKGYFTPKLSWSEIWNWSKSFGFSQQIYAWRRQSLRKVVKTGKKSIIGVLKSCALLKRVIFRNFEKGLKICRIP